MMYSYFSNPLLVKSMSIVRNDNAFFIWSSYTHIELANFKSFKCDNKEF